MSLINNINNNNLIFNTNSNSNLVFDNNSDLTNISVSPSNITMTYNSDGTTYATYDGTINLGSAAYTYINIEDIKYQFSVDDLLDAYSVEEFENAIRKRKLNRIINKDE